MTTKRIVCAAVRRGSRVALGARHYDDFMIALLGIPKAGDEQGFIAIESAGPGTPSVTQFVGREEAYLIAKEAGQLFPWADYGDERRLCSEGIY
jgi:hypothetical protein